MSPASPEQQHPGADLAFLAGGGEMGALIRTHDWSQTPLGPVETWPQSLRTAVSICLNSRSAMLVMWGEDLVKIYNSAYISILGRKHPQALGMRVKEAWGEVWDVIGPMLAGVMERGEASWADNLLLEAERNGHIEESYFTFSYSPIYEESGRVGGIFTSAQETTDQVIGERRLRTLRDLAESHRAGHSSSIENVCRAAAAALAKNPRDIPFAAFYLFDEKGALSLAARSGFDRTSTFLPPLVEAGRTDWLFAKAIRGEKFETVEIPRGTENVPSGPWPALPRKAVVLPIAVAGQQIGTLILGVSPRKPLEADYQSFLSMVGGQVNTAVAESLALEAEHTRAETSLPFGTAHLPQGQTASAKPSRPVRSEPYKAEAMAWPETERLGAPATTSDTRSASKDATSRPRIILADDNADMRAHISHILGELCEVIPVGDGAAALKKARENPPDLILSDVMVPGLDGFGLVRAVREDPALQEVPIILVSAHAGEESSIDGMQAGADDYLVKPFSARELIARVQSHLRMARFRREADAAARLRSAQFETFLNRAPVAVCLVDSDFRIREANPVALSVFGDIAAGVVGREFDEVVRNLWGREPADQLIDMFRQTIATGESRIAPGWSAIRAGRGVAEFYEWRLDRILQPDARYGVVCYFQDITERKRTELNANLLASIVESSDDAILSKNLNGIITSWNRGAERLFGYSAVEAVGQSVAILIPPDRLEEEPKILEKLRRGERVENFETIRVRKDGSHRNVSLTISPVRTADGGIVGASKMARDITERVHGDQALREANEALKLANIDLQQFAFAAAHDLQEPLRMVTTYTQLLSRCLAGVLDSDTAEYMRQVIGGSKRMSALLYDLLAYTEVTRDQDGKKTLVDLNSALSGALSNLQSVIKDSGTIVEAANLPRVMGNMMSLLQLFQNLISNAIKYRSASVPHVRISVERAGPEWKFSFRDNGIGIAPEYHERVFGVFKRLHGKEIPGTGIGLAICHRVVERSGGRIWVESNGKNQGSAFCFTLPVE